MRAHQLMWEPIHPLGRRPVLLRANVPYRLRQLLVHRLEAEGRHYDVLFLGTGQGSARRWGWGRVCAQRQTPTPQHLSVLADDGKVLKVGLPGEAGAEAVSLEEISVTEVWRHSLGMTARCLARPHCLPSPSRCLHPSWT